MRIKSLKALRAFRYGTRHLSAGDEFDVVADAHGRIFIAKGWAVALPGSGDRHPLAPPPAATADDGVELGRARVEYFERVGKRPYHGWDVAELRGRIAEAVTEAVEQDVAEPVEE